MSAGTNGTQIDETCISEALSRFLTANEKNAFWTLLKKSEANVAIDSFPTLKEEFGKLAGEIQTQVCEVIAKAASEKRKEEERRCLQHKNQRLPGDLKRMMEFVREIHLSKQEGKLFRRLSHRRFCIIRE